MDHYCTKCGRWRRLIAFWYCQDCLDRFYHVKGAAGDRAALVAAQAAEQKEPN